MRLSVEAVDTVWPPQKVAVMVTRPNASRKWVHVHTVEGPLAVVKANRIADRLAAGDLSVDWAAEKIAHA